MRSRTPSSQWASTKGDTVDGQCHDDTSASGASIPCRHRSWKKWPDPRHGDDATSTRDPGRAPIVGSADSHTDCSTNPASSMINRSTSAERTAFTDCVTDSSTDPFDSVNVITWSSSIDVPDTGPRAMPAISLCVRTTDVRPADTSSTRDPGTANIRCNASTPNTRVLPARRPAHSTRYRACDVATASW